MCRILLVRSATPFNLIDHLQPFAQLSQGSREYQGHGWGCSWLPLASEDATGWQHYHCIDPIWQDNLQQFGRTSLLLVHARSAFRDEGIVVENNMPFTDGESVFIFNGELRGVKIKSEGRIGAEKIYNYIRRMDKGDKCLALEKAVSIINKRTSYVRAMNIILSDGKSAQVSSTYNEDPDYFQMHRKSSNGVDIICSQQYPGETDWQKVSNFHTANV
ncbi:hypothetical protein AB833_15790 [Chromatiales bacterium (ex Bugula neritina AB1)]|nr:hypothetical protein AB833_15790 [Chromatiales bacterium (ex Bugula neritina AB1)]